ncbi:MAG: ATP synthase subunit I [Desulfobulbaceae bacterium]|nr:ATP synthase subunit I [Desulfobulbaceae bacterium]
MTNIPILLTMLCAGGVLGLFYFGGLWLTLHGLTGKSRWFLWMGASFMVRSTITVAGFWFLGAGDWQRFVALLTGFTLVRFFSVKRIPSEPGSTS